MIVKIFNFKKGEQGSKVKNYGKDTDQGNKLENGNKFRWSPKCIKCRTKINSKVFAFPILTESAL